MKLLTKDLIKKFQETGSQENNPNPSIICKFFTTWANWTWYATEYDPETRIFYGLVHGFENEWGYFSLDELEALKGPGGLGVERDLNFN
ncbi:MAG: DUF2958 domain-containing protein [Pseudomonadota bacterium]